MPLMFNGGQSPVLEHLSKLAPSSMVSLGRNSDSGSKLLAGATTLRARDRISMLCGPSDRFATIETNPGSISEHHTSFLAGISDAKPCEVMGIREALRCAKVRS